ncbi:hypothetical protein BJX70DRAFT_37644 [Aspergillus crustosus]
MSDLKTRRAQEMAELFKPFEDAMHSRVFVSIPEDDMEDAMKESQAAFTPLEERAIGMKTMELSAISPENPRSGFRLKDMDNKWDVRTMREFREKHVLPWWITVKLVYHGRSFNTASRKEAMVRTAKLDVLFEYAVFEERRGVNYDVKSLPDV